MKKTKLILTIVIAFIIAFQCIACSNTANEVDTEKTESKEISDTSEENEVKVGFALQTLEVAVWQRMVNGMEQAASDENISFKTFVADSDVSKQISNIENMISMGYDAIIVHVFDTEAFADVVQRALDAGIIVCAYDDDIIDAETGKSLDYDFSFICDNKEIGRRIGTMAAEWTKKTFPSAEKVEMGCLWHPEYKLQWDRVEGIRSALKELDPRVEIVEELEGLLVEDGVKAAETWTQTYPDLAGVVATNDTCLQGYAESWNFSGKDISDPNFGMFGCDGVQDAIDMVAEGKIIRGDVGLDVYKGGYDTVVECLKCIKGEKGNDIIMPMINVTKDTAQDWISDPNLYGK